MRSLAFQIRYPSGQIDRITMESERVLLGSGAHCELRLPVDQASVEHVVVELGAGGVFARALTFDPPPTLNGVPFTQSPVPEGSVLGVGYVQIMVSAVEGPATGAQRPGEKGSSKVGLVAFAIILAAGAYFLLFDEEEKPVAAQAKELPQLFKTKVESCPQQGPEALAFARDRMLVADAKRERRPFYPKDGVEAVPIYEQASACFRVGGDPNAASLADRSAEYLRHDMRMELKLRSVRFDYAYKNGDYRGAQHEVRTMLQLLEGQTGEYVQWLSTTDRQLKLKVGAAAAK